MSLPLLSSVCLHFGLTRHPPLDSSFRWSFVSVCVLSLFPSGNNAVGHTIPLPLSLFQEIIARWATSDDHYGIFPLGRQSASGHLLAVHSEQNTAADQSTVDVFFVADAAKPLILHWAFYSSSGDSWIVPGSELTPSGSLSTDRFSETEFQRMAWDTLNRLCPVREEDGDRLRPMASGLRLQCAHLSFPRAALTGVDGLEFVVRTDDSSSWYKDSWRNFRYDLSAPTRIESDAVL